MGDWNEPGAVRAVDGYSGDPECHILWQDNNYQDKHHRKLLPKELVGWRGEGGYFIVSFQLTIYPQGW